MEYREFTCVYCGRKAIDKSNSKTRIYCSERCAHTHYRRKHGVGITVKTPSCIYNKEVQCMVQKCGTCGWNPAVEKKRKERYHVKEE